MAARHRPRGGHGGYRQPDHPAPVSGPGAMSQRTDGGPADRQPVRPLPGGGTEGNYGDRKASIELQQGAPVAEAAPPPTGAGPPGSPPPMPTGPGVDPFGPTRRPDEPVTAGAMLGPGRTPTSGDGLRALFGEAYAATSDPDILDILEELSDDTGMV